ARIRLVDAGKSHSCLRSPLAGWTHFTRRTGPPLASGSYKNFAKGSLVRTRATDFGPTPITAEHNSQRISHTFKILCKICEGGLRASKEQSFGPGGGLASIIKFSAQRPTQWGATTSIKQQRFNRASNNESKLL